MNVAYEPIGASLLTGIFPGFAQPHFALHVGDVIAQWPNTFYAQRLRGGRIAAFDPLDSERQDLQLICRPKSRLDKVKVGDGAVYAYAFSPDDIAIGMREHIVNTIRNRFGEIAPKTFAARTAARFAELSEQMGKLNRRAFSEILEIDPDAASLWRDYDVFLPALRERFGGLNLTSRSLYVVTTAVRSRLTVIVDLPADAASFGSSEQIEGFARDSLLATSLFDDRDRLKLRVRRETARESQVNSSSSVARDRVAPLDRAKAYLDHNVFLPVLDNPHSSKKARNAVRATRVWVTQFKKIGDLIQYVDRFPPSMQSVLPFPGKSNESRRLEDVHTEFVRTFSRYRSQITAAGDFREGETYSAFDLSIFTQTYDNRGGGIRPVGKLGQHSGVVVNLTMSGGKYANTWIEPGKSLKCYLKIRHKGQARKAGRNLDVNRSILDFPTVPVMVFTRDTKELDFTYQGEFRLSGRGSDSDGLSWIELIKV